ncbi:DNRLRE domain-containing protein [Thermobrachium celere]|uniref:Uncharacterized protein n=1 Tax=Thermobrachium celere DSM 8682 TaxID=941824 RepID=R7RNP5_9CLOT|nr:DNRLRE domain-containing protein [Thermobrachium celere]GFR34987.1 hypothetical protein TCEA9_07990 [Thermobrachium celere]CDF57817.1 hypothetical protein TCEL_01731 [Thermobrachium celere DSM 8682]
MSEVVFLTEKTLTITDEQPDININTDIICCGSNGRYIYRSFVYFDLSSLPYNAFVTSARLQLFLLEDYFKCYSKNLYIYMLKEDFGEFTTFNQQPKVCMERVNTNISYKKYGLIEINITSFVQKWISGEVINKGLALKCDENKKSLVAFGSKNNSQYSAIPKLHINFIKSKEESEFYTRFVEVKEESFQLRFVNVGYSSIFDVSKIIIGSFFIKNIGERDVNVRVDVSSDGVNWIKDSEKQVYPNQCDILVPKYYGKHYRIVTYTLGEGKVDIKFIYQVYK